MTRGLRRRDAESIGVMHCAVRSVSVGGSAAAVAAYQPVAASSRFPSMNVERAPYAGTAGTLEHMRADHWIVRNGCFRLSGAWCGDPSHPSLAERRETAPRSRRHQSAIAAPREDKRPPRALRPAEIRLLGAAAVVARPPGGANPIGRRVVDTLAFARPDRQDGLSSIMRGWPRQSCSRASPSRRRPAM
jgi:hypothetical protein